MCASGSSVVFPSFLLRVRRRARRPCRFLSVVKQLSTWYGGMDYRVSLLTRVMPARFISTPAFFPLGNKVLQYCHVGRPGAVGVKRNKTVPPGPHGKLVYFFTVTVCFAESAGSGRGRARTPAGVCFPRLNFHRTRGGTGSPVAGLKRPYCSFIGQGLEENSKGTPVLNLVIDFNNTLQMYHILSLQGWRSVVPFLTRIHKAVQCDRKDASLGP